MMFRGEFFFLSNMAPCELEQSGLKFSCVEAAFQASKCVFEADRTRFTRLDGFEAKQFGKIVKLRPDWEKKKIGFMLFWLRKKFAQPEMREKLLATGDMELVETNTWGDLYWGQDLTGRGQNHLGRLLMQVRSELKEGKV